MSTLKNKIDFIALVSVTRANSNGDPSTETAPAQTMMVTARCPMSASSGRSGIGCRIWVMPPSSSRRTAATMAAAASANGVRRTEEYSKDREKYARAACAKWLDVRSFGQVFAFKDNKGFSVGVRGPVSVHQAVSVSPVDIESLQITKSVNGEKKEKEENRASDTMGMKHFVRFGLYQIKGSINVQLAEKTGFTEEDAATVKECLADAVRQRCFLRPSGRLYGGSKGLLVAAQLQGRAVFLRQGAPFPGDPAERERCDSWLPGGL